jgi:hypothetical protein
MHCHFQADAELPAYSIALRYLRMSVESSFGQSASCEVKRGKRLHLPIRDHGCRCRIGERKHATGAAGRS